MTVRDDFIEWKSDSQRTLERAQQLSTRANVKLQEASHVLSDLLLAKSDEAANQIELLKHNYAQLQLQVDDIARITAEYTNKHNLAFEKELKPTLLRLEKMLKTLRDVEVPLFLVPSEGQADQRLSDFVSWSELDLLRTNISIYQGNCAKGLDLVQSKTTQLKEKLHLASTKFLATVKLYDSKVAEVKLLMNEAVNKSAHKSRSNFVYTILRENSSLQNELASILKMLTNHYDQCCLAVQWNSTADEESVRVLQEDSRELPSVLKEVVAIHDVIENNCARANQFVEQKTPAMDEVLNQCAQWRQRFTQFENEDIFETLLVFLACKQITMQSSMDQTDNSREESASKESARNYSPIKEYIEVLEQLCYHYEQFKTVYETKYLAEFHRERFVYPREYLKQLDEYMNIHLQKFDQKERDRRRTWIQKYGEYIPLQFYLPGEMDQPQVVQILSEGLDEVQSESSKDNEAELLELIQKFKT